MEQTAELQDGFDIGGKLSRATSTMVRVTSGVHQGAEIGLDEGSITIGTEPDNDMVLFAENLCANHCRIERRKNPLAPLTVYAVDGSVVINGKRKINPGEYASAKGRFTLDLGNCRISVSPAIEYDSYAAPILKIVLFLAILLIGWVGWGIVSSLFTNVTTIGSSLGGMVSREAGELAGSISPKTDSEKLVWTVRSKLEELNLNAAVRATGSKDGNILLSGKLTRSQSGRWNEFLRWYDTNPTYPALIRNVQKYASDPAIPKVQSVWLNGTPTVHFKSGKKAVVGDRIGDGWEVKSIERTGVTLVRDGSPVVLKY